MAPQTSWAELQTVQSSESRGELGKNFANAARYALLDMEEEIANSVTTQSEDDFQYMKPQRKPAVTDRLVAWQLRRCKHCSKLMIAACVQKHLEFCTKKIENDCMVKEGHHKPEETHPVKAKTKQGALGIKRKRPKKKA